MFYVPLSVIDNRWLDIFGKTSVEEVDEGEWSQGLNQHHVK